MWMKTSGESNKVSSGSAKANGTLSLHFTFGHSLLSESFLSTTVFLKPAIVYYCLESITVVEPFGDTWQGQCNHKITL